MPIEKTKQKYFCYLNLDDCRNLLARWIFGVNVDSMEYKRLDYFGEHPCPPTLDGAWKCLQGDGCVIHTSVRRSLQETCVYQYYPLTQEQRPLMAKADYPVEALYRYAVILYVYNNPSYKAVCRKIEKSYE